MRRIAGSFLAVAVLGMGTMSDAPARQPAFPRSAASESVYASQACWRGCQSYCIWGLADCLKDVPQGICLKLTDRCDRYCQIHCRSGGGPFVPVE